MNLVGPSALGSAAVTEAVAEPAPAADPVVEQPTEPAAEKPVETPVVADPVADPKVDAKPEAKEEINPLAAPDDDIPRPGSPAGEKPAAEADKKTETEVPVTAKEGEEKPTTPAAEAAPIDYEAAYKQIMAPFKANGKMVELKDLSEAVALMQMGANYTRKMMDLAPHRKLLTMIQSNNLDEDRLSYLIDLDNKNPEAIKKLIKDAGIDPMDIDTSVEPAYLAGSHKVTDEQVVFMSALEELSSDPDGQKTLQVIDTQWDQASKSALWTSPEIMAVIHSQRENGIYDRISGEVDRLRTLGKIPANVSFLTAYKQVGDYLRDNGGLDDLVKPAQGQVTEAAPVVPPAEPKVVAVRAVAPQSPVKSDDQVSAASATRATPKVAKEPVNYLAMSDDEFLKQMQGRL
jgi:hypothetical protein